MINRIAEISLRNKFFVIAIFIVLVGMSLMMLPKLPVDAIPDIGENQVIVYADWPGRSPRDVEDQLTYPLTTALLGLPGVKHVRGNSMFGFSLINIIFDDNIEFYWARTRILEKLNAAQKELPAGVIPVLGPDASPLGQIFWYTIEGKGYTLAKLRSIQDYYVKFQLTAVKGVSEVAAVGGYIKQYQIEIDPNKLLAYNIPLSKVIIAVKKANRDVGAQVIEENGMEFVIRSTGFIRDKKDIENIPVGLSKGIPLFIKNIGNVVIGPDFRRSVLDKGGVETVGGVVLMRYGQNPRDVITRVKQKIIELSPGLPAGVKIKPFYDRTKLIDRSIRNLVITIIFEILITVLVILLFLLEIRTSIVIAMILPVSVILSMPLLYFFKVSPNIMSLGGIAIAIGIMVDAAIVVIENIYTHLIKYGNDQKKASKNTTGKLLKARNKVTALSKVPIEVYISAVQEVAGPIFYTMVIIIVAFLNIYFLDGQAGKLFQPLAFAKNFVMGISAVIAITLIPAIAVLIIKPPLSERSLKFSVKLNNKINHYYLPALKKILAKKKIFLLSLIGFSIMILSLIFFIESEFMPPLDEGDLLFMPVLLPGASISEVKHVLSVQDSIIKSFPEVESVVGKAGRADTATDPAPLAMIETIIQLKPKKFWRRGMTKRKLILKMNDALKIPGVSNIWTQPIRNRIDMLSTGIQTPIGIKIFGDDIKILEKLGIKIEKIVKEVKGAKNPYAERTSNKPYIEIHIDRERAARYGVNIDDANNIIVSAVGGINITKTVEGRERNPVRIRYKRYYRGSLDAIKKVLVPTKNGNIPLILIADIIKIPGPAKISTEDGTPYVRVFLGVDTDKRGVLDFVNEAKKKVASELKLPAGYFIVWSGQYKSEIRTRKKMIIIIPLTLLVITMLLYFKFKNVYAVAAILTALPFGFVGGVILQFILGVKFSTAVTVGYIALFGVAVEDGVVLMEFLMEKTKNKKDKLKYVLDACNSRSRPIVMTTLTTIIALIPVLASRGSGSEIMRPIAVPTFGGMITATLANLFLLPVLFIVLPELKEYIIEKKKLLTIDSIKKIIKIGFKKQKS